MKQDKKSNAKWILRYSIIAFVVIFTLGDSCQLFAQNQEIDKQDIPKLVVQRIEGNYLPCKENISWFLSDDKINADYYVASATGKNMSCESVYDKKGNLIRARTVLNNVKLPAVVHQAIASEFPDWRIKSDQAVIPNFDETKKQFHVSIERNGSTKTLYYDTMGNTVRSRSVLNGQKFEKQKAEMPSAVVQTVENNYLPCKETIKWYVSDKKATPDYYVATATGRNMSCESVYDEKGSLIQAKTIMKNVKLPAAVHDVIAEEYPDFKIKEDQLIMQDFDEDKQHYEVTIVKDGKSQILYYNANGKKIKKPRT